MNHIFIINPKAGKGTSIRYENKIKDYFKNSRESYSIYFTEYPGHGTEISKKHANEKDNIIYAIGGDGTVNEVLNGLIGSVATFGIIPSGTGNDFVRTMDLENFTDILDRTLMGNIRTVDIGKANDRFFLNIASVGFDAEVGNEASIFKKNKFLPSKIAYILSIIKTIFKFKPLILNINIDGKTFSKEAMLVTASNGKYYGGGIPITPMASIEDGLFDVCIIDKVSIFKLFRVFPDILNGKLNKHKEVSFYSGREVSVTSNELFSINIDGEIIRDYSCRFNVIPNTINLVFPLSLLEYKNSQSIINI